ENQAFAAAERNDEAKAIQIVYGPEYEAAKASIMGPIAECRRTLEQRLTSDATRIAGRATLLHAVAISALVLGAAATLAALLFFYGRRVVNPLVRLNGNLRDLIARKPGARIEHQDEQSELGEVARSMESYRTAVESAERKQWVKTSVAEIGDALQGVARGDPCGGRPLSKLVPLPGGGVGAFHLLEEKSGRSHFTAGYGTQETTERSFAPGEDVAGQAATERKLLVLDELPAN